MASLFDLGDVGMTREQVQKELLELLAGASEEQVRAILTMARVLIQK
ncbi:hypothetical protein NY78_3696 [Desulfovibrio sp. TomC]|nr:hypothetical protein NY78_3696 [Desulfovibrio sp. TomC]